MGRRGFLVAGVAGAAAGIAVVGGAAAWLFSHQGVQTPQRARSTATTGASATPTEQPTPTATPQLPSTYEQAWDNKDGRTLDLMFADGIRLTDNSPQPAPYGVVGARRLDGTDFFAQTPAQMNEATFINADRQGYYVNAPYLGYREELQTSGVNQGKVAIILIIGGVVHPGRTAADALKDTIYKRRVFAGFKDDRSKDAYIGVIFQDILSDNTTSGLSIFPDGFTDNPSTNNVGIHKGMSLVLTFANSDKFLGSRRKGEQISCLL
jgi:hypothetical protein